MPFLTPFNDQHKSQQTHHRGRRHTTKANNIEQHNTDTDYEQQYSTANLGLSRSRELLQATRFVIITVIMSELT